MPDPVDPPRKKKRAERPEPDYVIDPNKPNATIELETADLVSLATGGLVEAKANKTRELQLSDIVEHGEGTPVQDPKIIVDLGPDPDAPPKEQNVFVDLGADVPDEIATVQNQPMPRPPRASTPVNLVAPEPVAPPPRKSAPIPAQLPQEHRISASIPVTPPRPVAAPVEPKPVTPVNVQRVTPTMPKVEVAVPRAMTSQIRAPKRGMSLVVIVYLVSAAALATSIYFRWFA
ncbi:MAG: hypothetical protein M4D80_18150 [Myxococcota bacterium]|nr:hypothetical protein [Myxococcota bacterium]